MYGYMYVLRIHVKNLFFTLDGRMLGEEKRPKHHNICADHIDVSVVPITITIQSEQLLIRNFE